jgi:RNA polymerase sigma-54 factor
MAFELRQELRLRQQLVMTPQLQLSIKLLQFCRLEMVSMIQQEMTENPLLDEKQEFDGEGSTESFENAHDIPDAQPDALKKLENGLEVDWKSSLESPYRQNTASYDAGEERVSAEERMSRTSTLADHLTWQLRLSSLNQDEQQIGDLIIGNLNQDGYLQKPLIEIASEYLVEQRSVEEQSNIAQFNHLNWLTVLFALQKANKVLRIVQEFDPTGVAARDLTECLLIQIKLLGRKDSILEKMVKHHLKDLETKKYKIIASVLNVSVEKVIEAALAISQLEPRPGRPFNDRQTEYISPDIYVYSTEDEYRVVLNGDGLHRLRISPFYLRALYDKNCSSKSTREYIRDKMRSAIWLIKSIYQRERTIKKVMESIIKFQKDFFDHGVDHLKPLILKDVAEDIEMHESTVSRVTSNKYVHTPHGIFELKYFFNPSISSVSGENIASASVKNKIKELLAKEPPKKPYSDLKIASLLKNHNINIARRTIAKYREELGILPSSMRKAF